MKKIITILLVVFTCSQSFAQSAIIGKWKLVSMEDSKLGKLLVADSVAFYNQYWQGVTDEYKKEGKEITTEDSAFLQQNVKEVFYQMNNYTIQFNANKTYLGKLGNTAINGVYTYNTATRKLGKKEKGSTKFKYSFVTVENGAMAIDVPAENIKLYFDKVKK